MHLLTLLIAAVFSSSFVAPNAAATELTTSVDKVTVAVVKVKLPPMVLTLNQPAGTNPVWKIDITDDASGADAVTLKAAEIVPGTGNTFTFTHDPAESDIAALLTLMPAKLFIVYEDETPAGPIAAEITITADFTVDVTKIPITTSIDDVSTPIKLSEIATTKTWAKGGTVKVVISSEAVVGSKKHEFTVADLATAGEAPVIIAETQWNLLDIATAPAQIFVWAALTNTPDTTEPPFVIDIVEDIKVTAAITDASKAITGEITVSNALTSAVTKDELEIYVSYTEVDPSTLTSIVNATLKAQETKVYTIPSLTLPTKTPRLKKDDKVYFYASYVLKNAQAGAKTYFAFPSVVTVTEDPTAARFKVEPSSISVDDLQTHDELTITQLIGAPWTSIKVQLKLEDKAGDPFVTAAAIDVTDDVATLEWSTAIKTYLTGAAVGKKITVKVDPKATPDWTGTGVDITISAGRLCSIDPDAVELAEWKAGATFEVTVDDSITWAAASAIFVSLNPVAETVATDIKKTGLTMTDHKVSVAIAKGDLTNFGTVNVGTPVYFFVSTGGTTKDPQSPAKLTIEEDSPVLEFAVDPLQIAPAATKIEALKITPTTPADFAATIAFKITETAPTSFLASNAEVTGTAAKGTSTTTWTSGEVALTGFTVTAGKKFYVYASKTGAAPYLPVPAEIEVKAATTTTFVIAPAEINWAASLKLAKTEIVPTPAKPAEWPKANDTMSFRISPPAATNANDDPIAPITGKVIIEGAAGSEKWYIPADTEITTLVATEPKADVTLKVEIALAGTTYLTETTTLKVKAKEDPKVDAAMGVSPLLSLLAALVFLFVKLF